MQQVAERAGVSTSTVSHVINGTRYVGPELTARVEAAMRELRFRPNAVARSLRRKQTRTIGMIVPDNVNPFFAMLARAVEGACFAQGYSLILTNSEDDPNRERSNINVLLQKQVDGLIIAGVGTDGQETEELLRDQPVVVVDRELNGANADVILVDNLSGGLQATRHLIEVGHRRIACLAGPHRMTSSGQRVVGYRQALREAGLPEDEALILPGDFQFSGGAAAVEVLLRLPDPPTAIFACNDLMAVGALAAAAEHSLRIPADLSIVGFDDVTLATYTTPPLTTVAQPIAAIGRLATEVVIRRNQTPEMPVERHLLPPRLVVRRSTQPPAQL